MICDVRFLTLLCNKIKRLLRAICIPGGDIGRKKSSECTIRKGNFCENVSIDTAKKSGILLYEPLREPFT